MRTGKQTRWASVWIAGILLTALASTTIADDAADEEAERLEGTWKFVSLTVDGDEAPQEFLQTARWVIRGKSITTGDAKSRLRLDPSKSPKAIDMTGMEGPGKGKTAEGIYKLEGERLTICLPGGKGDSPAGRPRPVEFSGGKHTSLVVLERIKDE